MSRPPKLPPPDLDAPETGEPLPGWAEEDPRQGGYDPQDPTGSGSRVKLLEQRAGQRRRPPAGASPPVRPRSRSEAKPGKATASKSAAGRPVSDKTKGRGDPSTGKPAGRPPLLAYLFGEGQSRRPALPEPPRGIGGWTSGKTLSEDYLILGTVLVHAIYNGLFLAGMLGLLPGDMDTFVIWLSFGAIISTIAVIFDIALLRRMTWGPPPLDHFAGSGRTHLKGYRRTLVLAYVVTHLLLASMTALILGLPALFSIFVPTVPIR